MNELLVAGVLAVFIAIPMFRKVRGWCGDQPGRRPWLIAASVAALGLVAVLVPFIEKLSPPYSESPAGLFVILGRLAVVGLIAIAAVATLLGASLPLRPDPPDSDA